MGFVRRSPRNVGELELSLQKLFENKQYIKSVHANESSSHIEIDLTATANMFGGEEGKDFYLVIRRGKLREAKDLADSFLRGQLAPTRSEAQKLFDMIDPHGQ